MVRGYSSSPSGKVVSRRNRFKLRKAQSLEVLGVHLESTLSPGHSEAFVGEGGSQKLNERVLK